MSARTEPAAPPLSAPELPILRERLRSALVAKKEALREVAALCRQERAALRAAFRATRERELRRLRDEELAARAHAQGARTALLAQARASATSPIEAARGQVAIERRHAAEQRRITQDHQAKRKQVDRAHGRELAARAALEKIRPSTLAKLRPLLEKAGHIRRAPGETGAEALWRYAQAHPEEVLELLEPGHSRAVAVARSQVAAAEASAAVPPETRPRPPPGVRPRTGPTKGEPPSARMEPTAAPGRPPSKPGATPPAPTPARSPNAYERKKASRIERLRKRADRLEAEASARHASAEARANVIPFGQPILVGHHSERRDRRYRERIRNDLLKAGETQKRAEEFRRKARSAEISTAVSSDDPDAVAKLRANVKEVERDIARAKEINTTIRTAKRHGAREGKPWEPIAVAALRDRGLPPSLAEQLVKPDFAGRVGVPDYKLTNLGAERRRLEQRIAELEKRATAPPRPKETVGEASIWEEDNRVKISFPRVPPEGTRRALKGAGFRWSPTVGAWMRFASNQAWYEAKRIAGGHAGAPGGSSSAPSRASAEPELARVLSAVDAVRRADIGLSFVPDVLRQLAPTLDREVAKRVLLDAAKRGAIELRPEGGLGRLTDEEACDCPHGPQGTRLSWVRRIDARTT